MSMLRVACVLAVALCATAVVASPSSLWKVINPTGCSSAAFTPNSPGIHNITIWDHCQATAESVLVEVKCGWPRIPVENITVAANPWYPGGSSAGVHVVAHACYDPLQREVDYLWVRRGPGCNDDDCYDYSGDTDSDYYHDELYLTDLDTGVTSFTSIIRDGCYEYRHNISVHFDGYTVTIVPSITPLQSRQVVHPIGSSPFNVRILDGLHDLILGAAYNWYTTGINMYQQGYTSDYQDDPNSFGGWMEQTTYNIHDAQSWYLPGFAPLWFFAHVSPASTPNGLVANNQTEFWWTIGIPDDKIVLWSDDSEWYFMDKALWPWSTTWTPETDGKNYTSGSWTQKSPQGGWGIPTGYWYPGNASSPLATPITRGVYTDSDRDWTVAQSNASYYIHTSTWFSTSFNDPKHPLYNVPICRFYLNWDSSQSYARVQTYPVENNQTYNYASCVGNYRINVTAISYWEGNDGDWWYGPGYTQESRAFSVSCGLPPEIQPDPSNPKVVTFYPDFAQGGGGSYEILDGDWTNSWTSSNVRLQLSNVANAWGYTGVPDYRITWAVVSEPAGSHLGADMGNALYTFSQYDYWWPSSGSSSQSNWDGDYGNVWLQTPPVGWNINVRPTVAGTYVFNVTYWNGCTSTSVLEYLTVVCPSDRAAVTFPSGWATSSASTYTFMGGNNFIQLNAHVSFTDSSTSSGGYYRPAIKMNSYPTSFPWIANAAEYWANNDIPFYADYWNNWNGLYPWGPGTYTFTYTSDHGCGAVASQDLTVTVACENPNTTPATSIDAQDHSDTITNLNNYWTYQYHLQGKVTWVNSYTNPTQVFRYTWILQSYNGVAVTASEKNTIRMTSSPPAQNSVTTIFASNYFQWTQDNGDVSLPIGTYAFKFVVDDGCKSDSSVFTLTVGCTTDTTVVTTSAQSNDIPLQQNTGFVNRWIDLQYTITGQPSGSSEWVWSVDKADKVFWSSNDNINDAIHSGNPRLFPIETGALVVTLKLTDGCGKVITTTMTIQVLADGSTPSVTSPCAAVTLTGTYNFHSASAPPRVVTESTGAFTGTVVVPFSHNHFPHIHLNFNSTDFGTAARRTSAQVFYSVKSAPVGSVYAAQEWAEEDIDWNWNWNEKSTVYDPVTWIKTTTQVVDKWSYDVVYYPGLAVNKQFQSVFLPDVAGDYVIEAFVATDCKTSTPNGYWSLPTSMTFRATCSSTAPVIAVKDATGAAVAGGSTITLVNTHQGSESMVLDASKSTKDASLKLFYHWYWETVDHGIFYDGNQWQYADDHVGLGTPFGAAVVLDAKLIPPQYRHRKLFLTISDGCQNATTSFRIEIQCNGDNVNLLADRSSLVLDPLICLNKVNLRTGVCINHYDFSVTVTPALVTGTAAQIADQTFALNYQPVQQESSGPNKLAIGLGIGLGLGLPILCLIGYCVYRSSKKNHIKDSA